MRAIVTFFVKYPIWANVLIFIALAGGLGTYYANLKKSSFPERDPNRITVTRKLSRRLSRRNGGGCNHQNRGVDKGA